MSAPSLPDAQVESFGKNGYLHPVPVLSDAEVQRHLGAYMQYVQENKARLDALPANQKYQVLSETHFAMPWVHEIVSNPRVLDAVESLIGPNILAWNATWFSKMPGDKTFVSWHQDGTYWNLTPPTVVTAWIALTPVSSANGCLRVIPGTHKQPQMPQRETYNKDNALSRGQEIAVAVDEAQAVDIELQPGEMSLHHIWIVHGSKANTGSVPRIGIAVRYVPPHVLQDSPAKPFAQLLRGRDTHGNFEILPAPEPGNAAAQVERHKLIVERLRAGIMKK